MKRKESILNRGKCKAGSLPGQVVSKIGDWVNSKLSLQRSEFKEDKKPATNELNRTEFFWKFCFLKEPTPRLQLNAQGKQIKNSLKITNYKCTC